MHCCDPCTEVREKEFAFRSGITSKVWSRQLKGYFVRNLKGQ